MSFFSRKSKTTKASAAELERPKLVKSQSADANRYSGSSRGSFDNHTTIGHGAATRDSQSTRGSTASLLHKFQGDRAASASASALGASKTASKSSRGRDVRRKPIVVHYELSPALDARHLPRDMDTMTKTHSSIGVDSSQRTYSVERDADSPAPFDVESAVAGFMASFSPSKTISRATSTTKKSKTKSKTTGSSTSSSQGSGTFDASLQSPVNDAPSPRQSVTRTRSNTLQRLSSVNLLSSTQRHAQRAELKAKKYDVEWRNDQDATCCQVCYAMFTKLSRRRHHCRVCGDLVCGDCSNDQVLLQGRFEAPKRACVACVTLLQVMKHNGDPRVVIDGASSKTPDSAALAANQPVATPRYRDRLGEVHRVMAAGKKSERRGSTQSEMYVISSKWLRSWLAFTRSTDGSNNQIDHSGDISSNGNSPGGSPLNSHNSAGAPPPGPIDNMPLLELSKGKLVKRPELVRDDNVRDDTDDEDGGGGDYQLISTEVWEVLQRLYGGGPAIRVVSDDGFRDWIVDVYALLATAASHVAIAPTVEHVLVTRHEAAVVTRASHISVEKAALISSGGYESVNILAQSSRRGSFSGGGVPRPSTSRSPATKDSADKSSDRGSFSNRSSMNQARVRPNSPQCSSRNDSSARKSSSQAHYESQSASSRLRTSAAKHNVGAMDAADDMTGSNRDSNAATAASAFAVAMKQARLNAQKAIDDRSRAQQQQQQHV